jgi:alkyl sulfatase BDS1-like metallo-beta-lactamase superfamily hydrolase
VTDGIYQVRDGNAWAEYIMESLALYGDKADVVFQSHNWPHWGNDTIQEYMTNTAAVYKFINDQTLLYINEGYTETEIANMIQLPKELEKVWYTRQYYGTVSHNSKAVYEKYMGWYDANPVHLAELTPSDYAQKLVEYFGDTDAVQKNAENVAALIEQEGDETCLTRLMDAVTVTSEYKYFNIIEP